MPSAFRFYGLVARCCENFLVRNPTHLIPYALLFTYSREKMVARNAGLSPPGSGVSFFHSPLLTSRTQNLNIASESVKPDNYRGRVDNDTWGIETEKPGRGVTLHRKRKSLTRGSTASKRQEPMCSFSSRTAESKTPLRRRVLKRIRGKRSCLLHMGSIWLDTDASRRFRPT
jgi:hypothetical protein